LLLRVDIDQFPAQLQLEALAFVKDEDVWSALVPTADPAAEQFVVFSFHFTPGLDNSGFVGWLAAHIKATVGSGVFVVCGSNAVRGGIFDYWGAPKSVAEAILKEVKNLRQTDDALSDAEKLANYVKLLPHFKHYTFIDCNYGHIGATVADAILQANNKYSTNVKPRVRRILSMYPEKRTTSDVLSLLETISATDFLDWRGADLVERFQQVLELFQRESIEKEEDLRSWLKKDSNLSKLQAINGIGPKTVDYFKILVGILTSAIDRHLFNFLELAGLKTSNYLKAQSIINEAADILSIDRANFDHSIWQFMSKKVVC
jgi:endonuclease III